MEKRFFLFCNKVFIFSSNDVPGPPHHPGGGAGVQPGRGPLGGGPVISHSTWKLIFLLLYEINICRTMFVFT